MLVPLGLLGLSIWVVVVSLQEERVDWFLNLEALRIEPKFFHVAIETVDEVSGRASANAQVVFREQDLPFDESTRILFQGGQGQGKKLRLYFAPFAMEDLGRSFSVLGLWSVQEPAAKPAPPPSTYGQNLPPPIQAELTALGNPRLYPFDRYLIMGRLSCDAWVTVDGKEFTNVPGNAYEIDLRAPGFLLRGARGKELEQWPTVARRVESLSDLASEPYRGEIWRQKQFALILQRPLFLRFFTALLGLVALVSLPIVVKSAEPKQLLLNSASYFIALWAIRQALSIGAPKTPTMIDYATMLLYCSFIASMLTKFFWPRKGSTA